MEATTLKLSIEIDSCFNELINLVIKQSSYLTLISVICPISSQDKLFERWICVQE